MKLYPSQLNGCVKIPASKSLLHRAIICASLARGKSVIKNVTYSDDIDATIQAMKTLGTMIFKYDDYLEIDGTTTFFKSHCTIDCCESGSTLRFLIPLSIAYDGDMHFIGQGRLGKRPLDVYYHIFDQQNIAYLYREEVLDLYIRGHLSAGVFEVPGNVSSQFISGLLFALPLMEKDSKIIVTSPLESRGYVDLTIEMLGYYGIEIINYDYKEFVIVGNQRYCPCDYEVEGDYSQAAYYFVANKLGHSIKIDGLKKDSRQGDRIIVDIVNSISDHYKIDGSQCPDLVPIVALMCCLTPGTHVISHLSRLRFKESDRLIATYDLLKGLGAQIEMNGDCLVIEGVNQLCGGKVSSQHDHRLAMVAAIAATVCYDVVVLDDGDCVKKSYPVFFDDYRMLGGRVDECELGS